jgi:hypothetical protein
MDAVQQAPMPETNPTPAPAPANTQTPTPPLASVTNTAAVSWSEALTKPPAYKNINAQVARLWPRPIIPSQPTRVSESSQYQ